MASHIAAVYAGVPIEIERVNLREHLTESGEDFYKINPKGYIPALLLDNGHLLTEGVAILQYLSDLNPDSNLAPHPTAFERYLLQEWLTFVNSEIHKVLGGFFAPNLTEESRQIIIDKALKRFAIVEAALAKNPYLLGNHFSAADAYLFTCTRWAFGQNMDLSGMPNLLAFMEKVGNLEAVKLVMKAEGIA